MTKARDNASGGLGLILIKPSSVVNGTDNGKGTVSFSGVGSVSLNNIFSSTYDNYKVVFYCDTNSTFDTQTYIRLRTGGSDLTSAVYSMSVNGFDSNNASANGYGEDLTAFTIAGAGESGAFSIDILSPNRTQQTIMLGISVKNYATNNIESRVGAGLVNNTTSYDGITIYPTSPQTMTGTVSVYGYNK